ncbi:MAG: hypothetical protein ABIN61_08050 [candidate division WOR-3 bacterium]
MEKEIKEILEIEKEAKKIVEEAENKADQIRKEAEKKAEEIILEAKREAESIIATYKVRLSSFLKEEEKENEEKEINIRKTGLKIYEEVKEELLDELMKSFLPI